MFVNFNILNQLGSPAINSNTFANRPAAGQTGRLFVSTDTFEIYRDNGTTWDLIGGPGSSTITGTGTATQVAYFTSSQAIGSSANLYWDNTNTRLGIGTASPTNALTIVGSGNASGDFTANRLIKIGGLSSEYLMADGSTSTLTNTITGTGTATQVAYFTSSQAIGSSANLYWDNTAGALGINTATPGAELDVHGTGTIAQFNTTSATGNTYLAFQRTGTGLWRIGDTYNGGNNFFELHNTVLGTDALEFEAATNKSAFQAQQTYTTGLARGNYFDYNLSVAAGGSFSSPNAITALTATLDLTLAGNATIPSGARSGLDAYNTIAFTGAGTLTHNQGTQIRAYSNLTAGWAFNGTAIGTITHLAGLRALFPDNTGSAVTVTNNYALLLNDQTANTGTVTYTNRWGVYQEGASDLNYMAANLLLGSTVNSGEKLQVTGTAKVTSTLTVNSLVKSGGTSSQILAADGSVITAGTNITISSGTISSTAGGLGGTGTTNNLAKFTGSTTLGNSLFVDTGTFTGINVASPTATLQVNGNVAIGYSVGTGWPSQGLQVAGVTILNALQFRDAQNITFNTLTGTKIGTATSQKLAFWNATPIVQPTTAVAGAARVAGGGATVTDTDTFGGYTIAQVVQALRNTGILA